MARTVKFECAPDVNYVECAVAGELVRIEAGQPLSTDDPVLIGQLESLPGLVSSEVKPKKKADAEGADD